MVAVSWLPFHGRRSWSPFHGDCDARRWYDLVTGAPTSSGSARGRAAIRVDRERAQPRAAPGAVSVMASCPAGNYRIDMMDVIINYHSRCVVREPDEQAR